MTKLINDSINNSNNGASMKDRSAEYVSLLVTKYGEEYEEVIGLSLVELRNKVDSYQIAERQVTVISLTPAGHVSRKRHPFNEKKAA